MYNCTMYNMYVLELNNFIFIIHFMKESRSYNEHVLFDVPTLSSVPELVFQLELPAELKFHSSDLMN